MRKPEWLHIKRTGIHDANIATERLIQKLNLHTVCESARCPNKGECFNNQTATFMILGDVCTRNCTFCAVSKDKDLLLKPDEQEPQRIAEAVKVLQLDYVVLTMVTRDDLEDGGAEHLIKVIQAIRSLYKTDVAIEILISDLQGSAFYLRKIIDTDPTVFNHNIETISRLYPQVRPQANYQRSLHLLKAAKEYNQNMLTKSGFMVGLGESETEVISLMRDLLSVQVDLLTIGQYLAPSKDHHPVFEYITPEKFTFYRQTALNLGFKECFSGPFVRSSYKARNALYIKKNQC